MSGTVEEETRDNSNDPNSNLPQEDVHVPTICREPLLKRQRIIAVFYAGILTFGLAVVLYTASRQIGQNSTLTIAESMTIGAGIVILPLAIAAFRSDLRGSYHLVKFVHWRSSELSRLFLRRAKSMFVGICLLATVAFYEITSNPAGTATVLYATILFTKEILLDQPAVLEFSDSDTHYSRIDDHDPPYTTLSRGIQNIGGDDASMVSITYSLYDESGTPLIKKTDANISPDEVSLDSGDNIPADHINMPYPRDVESHIENHIWIHMRAEDGYGYSWIPARTRKKHSVSD